MAIPLRLIHLVLFLSHRLLVLMLKRLVEILGCVQLLVVADQLVLQLGHLRVFIIVNSNSLRPMIFYLGSQLCNCAGCISEVV